MASFVTDNNNIPSKQDYFRISIPTLLKILTGLPLVGASVCVILSLLFDFASSTATHCKVPNYLPSISSAIGGYTPQRYIWRICIALHCAPRFLLALGYFNYHTSVDMRQYNSVYTGLAALATTLHICENMALVALTYVSSSENIEFHENAFIAFMVFSLTYMLLTCILFSWGRTGNGRKITPVERKSLNLKATLFIFNLFIFLFAVYLYFRHHDYCEPGVYTGFAACEYLTVISNIAFHGTVSLDWKDYTLMLSHNDFVDKLQGKSD
ncbi:post-GPI attachment to proteins factor 2-like [Haliotis cracherodii]|uniref:post-GPI attachment to proteins factor 2-like n=1 Tax=Haliotis cracherodii TaxID=6455 RepID=UPI0039E7C94C